LPKGAPRYILLVLLFIGAQVLFLQSTIFRIHTVYINGNHSVSNKDLVDQLQLAIDQPLWKHSPGELAKKLTSRREIYQATVTMGLPGRVEINLVERTPVIQISTKSRHPHWFAVDKEGIVLRALPQGDSQLPRLMLEEPVNLETHIHPKRLHDLAHAIRTIATQLPQQIWYYSLDERGYLSLRTFANRHPFNVEIGEIGNLDYKMHLLHSLLEQTPKELIPLNVDLRFNSPSIKFLNPPPVLKPEEKKA
jgi:hypothetical protein